MEEAKNFKDCTRPKGAGIIISLLYKSILVGGLNSLVTFSLQILLGLGNDAIVRTLAILVHVFLANFALTRRQVPVLHLGGRGRRRRAHRGGGCCGWGMRGGHGFAAITVPVARGVLSGNVRAQSAQIRQELRFDVGIRFSSIVAASTGGTA